MTRHNPVSREIGAVEVQGVSRGAFMLRGVLATATAFGASAATPFVGRAIAQSGSSDIEILNFALTLEYLEARFYEKKGRAVKLSGDAKRLAREFGEHEAAHVDALTAAIREAGGKPAAMPKFSFPVTDQKSFLDLAYTVENVGVSAYNGAGPMLGKAAYLEAAGSIVQVEARHAAAIGLLTGKSPTPDGGFDKALTKNQVLRKVKPLIAS